MIRNCNGQDRFLVGADGGPCACGLTFDDAVRLVTFPHELLGPKRSIDELRAMLATLPRVACRETPTRFCPLAFEGGCRTRPCARFESDDESPWLREM